MQKNATKNVTKDILISSWRKDFKRFIIEPLGHSNRFITHNFWAYCVLFHRVCAKCCRRGEIFNVNIRGTDDNFVIMSIRLDEYVSIGR